MLSIFRVKPSIVTTTAVVNDVAMTNVTLNATALEASQDATITVWIVMHLNCCQSYVWVILFLLYKHLILNGTWAATNSADSQVKKSMAFVVDCLI